MLAGDRNSSDGNSIADTIAEFTDGEGIPEQQVPVKKLSDAFDSCAKGEGQMKVYLRIRPISAKCMSESTITVDSDQTIVTNAPESSKRAQYTKLEERKYAFSRVFAPHSLQGEVFMQAMSPLLDRFLKGDNCVFFAYGMTNSGKTHTIQGTEADQGLLPRLVTKVLEAIQNSPSNQSELTASALEIYQEKIFDLLGKKTDKPEKLSIRDGSGKVEVCKLSEHPITLITDVTRLMDVAAANRSKSTTLLNSGSSRSHAVYTLTLKRESLGKDAVFHVVDLAGAERSNRTKANVQQQKEANNINTSLMQLWRCLQGMKRNGSEGTSEKNTDIIPFRDSKLTHLLMPQLCRAGLSGVAMIACVNPHVDDYDETLSILGNASLASKIREIADLRRTVPSVGPQSVPSAADEQLKAANVVANAISAATALGKRRRAEHNSVSVADIIPEKRNSKRCSAITQKVPAAATVPIVAAEAKRPVSRKNVKIVTEDVEVQECTGPADSGVKRMHIEITRLTEENNMLLSEQFTRETEIRIEVSLEMAKRSAHLLDQIQDLQYQLNGKDTTAEDLSKSCKKIRRTQLDKANDEMAKDLEEAEEELERVKVDYEEQLLKMREEKEFLAGELEKWKSKTVVHQKRPIPSSLSPKKLPVVQVQVLHDPVLPVPSNSSTQSSSSDPEPVRDSLLPSKERVNNASTEFSKRMSRDNRFKKLEGNSCGLSAVRSPLGPVKEDSNSDKKRNVLVAWESPKGDPVSPLRFDSSPKQMFRQKENLISNLPSQSVDESSQKNTSRLNASAEKVTIVKHVSINNASHDNKLPPKTRANIVSARRVISTRINTHTNQAPSEASHEQEDADCGANPNAGNYISRLRTRTVR